MHTHVRVWKDISQCMPSKPTYEDTSAYIRAQASKPQCMCACVFKSSRATMQAIRLTSQPGSFRYSRRSSIWRDKTSGITFTQFHMPPPPESTMQKGLLSLSSCSRNRSIKRKNKRKWEKKIWPKSIKKRNTAYRERQLQEHMKQCAHKLIKNIIQRGNRKHKMRKLRRNETKRRRSAYTSAEHAWVLLQDRLKR